MIMKDYERPTGYKGTAKMSKKRHWFADITWFDILLTYAMKFALPKYL